MVSCGRFFFVKSMTVIGSSYPICILTFGVYSPTLARDWQNHLENTYTIQCFSLTIAFHFILLNTRVCDTRWPFQCYHKLLKEAAGFEPAGDINPLLLSRQVLLASQPCLHKKFSTDFRMYASIHPSVLPFTVQSIMDSDHISVHTLPSCGSRLHIIP